MIEVPCTASLEPPFIGRILWSSGQIRKADGRAISIFQSSDSHLENTADRLKSSTRLKKAMGYLFLDGWDFLVMNFLPGISER